MVIRLDGTELWPTEQIPSASIAQRNTNAFQTSHTRMVTVMILFLLFLGKVVCTKWGCTPEFLNKKHLNFGQGLEFLKFGQGNRGLNQQHRRKSKETIRKNEVKRRNFDKKIRVRGPYFLFNNFLSNLFSVWLI